MGSFFDNLRDLTFDTTKDVFGYTCSWESRDLEATYEGKVHFKNPTDELRMQAVEYNPDDWQMEYKEGDFVGLKERVQRHDDNPEIVTIDSNKYYVMSVIMVSDGGTYRANLKPINNNLDGGQNVL